MLAMSRATHVVAGLVLLADEQYTMPFKGYLVMLQAHVRATMCTRKGRTRASKASQAAHVAFQRACSCTFTAFWPVTRCQHAAARSTAHASQRTHMRARDAVYDLCMLSELSDAVSFLSSALATPRGNLRFVACRHQTSQAVTDQHMTGKSSCVRHVIEKFAAQCPRAPGLQR